MSLILRWIRTHWWAFLLLAAILSWMPFAGRADRRERIDPLYTIVVEGDYAVRTVSDLGTIGLLVPTTAGNRCLSIELLGVEFEPTDQVVAWLRGIVEGKSVRIRFDRRRLTEKRRELQAYVFVDDLLVNEAIVRAGLAVEATHPADSGEIMRRIKKAEQMARAEGLGIWSFSTPLSSAGPFESDRMED